MRSFGDVYREKKARYEEKEKKLKDESRKENSRLSEQNTE